MTENKRQLEIEYSSHKKTKKLRNNVDNKKKSITSIENLSNELFLEIFEYFDGCDILIIFSNLNSRFQYLLDSPALLLKINFYSQPKSFHVDYYIDKIIPNQHRIISLKLINLELDDFLYKIIPMNPSFSRLESLNLFKTPAEILKSILISLYALPSLFSLTINSFDAFRDFTDIFSLIFGLPRLKYCNTFLYSNIKISLPAVSNVQANSIRHLVTHEQLTIKELIGILSYTPQLNRLVCKVLFNPRRYIAPAVLPTFSGLTHISINRCYISFDSFEKFISMISSQLQVLRLSETNDFAYLDADRWERLIKKYIPNLHTFDFQYYQLINDTLEQTSYHISMNRFNSLFWIQKQWCMEIKIDEHKRSEGFLIYSIGSSKKKWYNLSDHIVSTENFQLTLIDLSFVNCIDLFMDLVCPILTKTQITRLVVMDCKISIDMLSKILNRLPYLTSLIIWSWSYLKTFVGTAKQHTIQTKYNDNKIRKVCLEKLMKWKPIEFLIDLCPHMDYLEILNITCVNLQSLLQFIIRKHETNIRHHFILCLKSYQIENEIMEKLQRTINEEKQNDNYTITRAYENIYLECKY